MLITKPFKNEVPADLIGDNPFHRRNKDIVFLLEIHGCPISPDVSVYRVFIYYPFFQLYSNILGIKNLQVHNLMAKTTTW